MHKRLWLVCALCLLFPIVALAGTPAPVATHASASHPEMRLGLSMGVDGGVGGEADLTLDHFAGGLPVAARLAAGYHRMDPGRPLDARHVFINANDNGDPIESGHRWDLRMDAVWYPGWMRNLWVYGGPRYSRFTATFDFIGGNEFFDVTSNQWGLGVGAEGRFPMSARTSLVLGAGLDHYWDSTLAGHDTAYNPDGTSVSAVDNYTYADADAAINQPQWAPRLTIGVGYRLGR
jgi:hypothetical protein